MTVEEILEEKPEISVAEVIAIKKDMSVEEMVAMKNDVRFLSFVWERCFKGCCEVA